MLITVNQKIYSLEAVLNACYSFLDRAYIFLDYGSKSGTVKINLTSKNKLGAKKMKSLAGEFMNELLHSALRCEVSKNNRKIREYIIGRGITSALPVLGSAVNVLSPLSPRSKLSHKEDPLGIAIPWEEKYGKKKGSKH